MYLFIYIRKKYILKCIQFKPVHFFTIATGLHIDFDVKLNFN